MFDENDYTDICAKRIYELMARENMTQKQLAGKIFSSDSTISNILSGKRAPTVEQLYRIAELFNVSTDYLLGRADKENDYAVHSLADLLRLYFALHKSLNVEIETVTRPPVNEDEAQDAAGIDEEGNVIYSGSVSYPVLSFRNAPPAVDNDSVFIPAEYPLAEWAAAAGAARSFSPDLECETLAKWKEKNIPFYDRYTFSKR